MENLQWQWMTANPHDITWISYHVKTTSYCMGRWSLKLSLTRSNISLEIMWSMWQELCWSHCAGDYLRLEDHILRILRGWSCRQKLLWGMIHDLQYTRSTWESLLCPLNKTHATPILLFRLCVWTPPTHTQRSLTQLKVSSCLKRGTPCLVPCVASSISISENARCIRFSLP